MTRARLVAAITSSVALSLTVACASTPKGTRVAAAPAVTPHAAPSRVAPSGAARQTAACAGPTVTTCELDALFGAPALQPALLSILVESLDTGEVLYRLNPDSMVIPASNEKIVTTAVASARLGWDFRYRTTLEMVGRLDETRLRGDLIVKGGGDPSINARDQRAEAFFDEVATILRERGIMRVEGRLIGDDDAFEDERFGYGWAWDDFAYGYSAPVGALQFNENEVSLTVTPGAKPGDAAMIVVTTDGSDLTIVNRVTTALGPAFLECASARFTPHSSATRETRTRAQLEALELRCPIRAHAGALRARGELDDATLAALEHEARARVDDAVAFAEASPMPGPEELLDDVG